MEVGESRAKTCKKVLGVDANAVYLGCMVNKMPTGYPVRRFIENGLGPESNKRFSKVAHGWLSYVSWTRGERICHQRDGGERRLGQHRLPVDGFAEESRTAYQFHGCFWHGHPSLKSQGHEIHPVRQVPMKQLLGDTLLKEKYIRSLGYGLETVWECEWEKYVGANPDVRQFLKTLFSSLYPTRKEMTLETAVSDISTGAFFGLVECDIRVPAELEEKFSEMAPIFKNVPVSREDLSSHMREFADERGFLKSPQRMLVGSLFGEKILLLSELAKWYLEKGLVITKIYQMVDYIPRAIYAEFASSVSAARRLGDADPDMTLLANTSKLIGNSAYGKTITNKERHRNVRYVDGDEDASVKIRGVNFDPLTEIDDEYYEIVMCWSSDVCSSDLFPSGSGHKRTREAS
jgi:hypothetical protein